MSVDRLMSLMLILTTKGTVTAEELSNHFEVSIRTIYRDIDKLCEAGVPISAISGVGGGFKIMDGYSIDDLFINKNEMQPLLEVMDNLNVLFGKNNNFNDIVLKMRNTYDKKFNNRTLNINLSHFSMEEELKQYLYEINKAIEHSKVLEFEYINRRMERERRVVEPIYISYTEGQWYLAAFCRVRNDYRKFKLVRIRDLKVNGKFIKKEIDKDTLEKIFDAGFIKKSINITLRFSERIGDQLEEYFDKKDIKKEEDGRSLVNSSFPREEGLIKFILNFGNDCEVLYPKEIREEIKNYIKNLLEIYNH